MRRWKWSEQFVGQFVVPSVSECVCVFPFVPFPLSSGVVDRTAVSCTTTTEAAQTGWQAFTGSHIVSALTEVACTRAGTFS